MSAEGRAVGVAAAGGAIGSAAGCGVAGLLTVEVGEGAAEAGGLESMQPVKVKASDNVAN